MDRHCTVDIRGIVSSQVGKARIALHRGRYDLIERTLNDYELRPHGSARVFNVSLVDVIYAFRERQMTLIEGRWP